MKKIIQIACISFLVVSCTERQKIKKSNNDLAKMNLHGKVKSIIHTRWLAKIKENGELEKMTWVENKRTYYFNAMGNISEIIENSKGGDDIKGRQEFKYDERGNKIEWIIYNNNGNFQEKTIYTNDSRGNIIEENVYFQGRDATGALTYAGKIINIYDAYGNKIESNKYPKDGNPGDKINYTYDEKGNLIEEKNGNHVITNKYDNKNNIIETKLEGITKISYTYDSNDNWVKQLVNSGEGSESGTSIIEREYKFY